jgi:flagellar biosynthesis/type III secretory pathway chaperone
MTSQTAVTETKLEALKRLLQDEISLHQALKDVLDEESRQDGKLDSAALLRIQQRKYHTARQIQDLESQRIALVKELARAWGEPAEALTLRRIGARVGGAAGGELLALHADLLSLVDGIRALARETGANAAARLKALDATLAVIHEAVHVHATYSGAGKLQSKPVTFKYTSA